MGHRDTNPNASMAHQRSSLVHQPAVGQRLLVQRSDAHEMVVTAKVLSMAEGHWRLRGPTGAFRRGLHVRLEWSIQGDARYRLLAQVKDVMEDTLDVEPVARIKRMQERRYPRAPAYGLPVELHLPTGEAIQAEALNISAGGARVQTRRMLRLGDQMVCHFQLQGAGSFTLQALVVRCVRVNPGDEHPQGMAIAFLGISEDDRARLLRWSGERLRQLRLLS